MSAPSSTPPSGLWHPAHLADNRVTLTPLRVDDFESLYAVAADPLIWEQHPNPDRYRRDVFTTFFAGAMASGGALVIRDLSSGAIIGSSRFYDHRPAESAVNIGYTFFARRCWGQGYNPAVKRLMLGWAFQHVAQVFFHVGAHNLRSQIALGRLGVEKVGQLEVAYHGEPPRLNFIYRLNRP
jgi:RimJ/RimL family protein N-acetyltransferase